MSYPPKLLTDNEEIKLDVHPHWSALVPAETVGVIVSAGLIAMGVAGWLSGIGGRILLGLFGVVMLWVAWQAVSYLATDFVVTTIRIIYRHGVFGRQSQEIPLAQVTNTRVTRGVLERMLGNGTLIVESAGRDSTEKFLDIAHTEKVHQLVSQLMEDQRAGRGRVVRDDGEVRTESAVRESSGDGPRDLATQLEKISTLHESGKLSDEEFAAAKSRLLGE